jgi:hypothetical protein
MQNTYKTYENQHPNVEKYSLLVTPYGPYRFFASLSFQYFLSEKQAIDSASKVVVGLNRKLLELDWPSEANPPPKSCPFPTGIAVLEKTSIRKKIQGSPRCIKDRGNCHFHFLLRDHPKLSSDPTRGLWQLSRAWGEVARGLNYQKTRKLVSVNGTDVQLVVTNGVIGYVLKEAKNSSWKYQERLFYLDREGLLPIDLSQLRFNRRAFRTL